MNSSDLERHFFWLHFFSLNCPKKDVFLLKRPYWQQSLQLELDCYTENVICQPQSYITIMLSDYSIFFCDSRKFTNHILFAYPQNISNRCKTNWLYHRRGWQNYVHLQSEILASIKCDNKFKDRMTIWTIWPVEKFHTKHTLPVCVVFSQQIMCFVCEQSCEITNEISKWSSDKKKRNMPMKWFDQVNL